MTLSIVARQPALEGELATEVAGLVEQLGFPSLDDWAGWANYEERLVPGKIDPVVLEKLREAAAERRPA